MMITYFEVEGTQNLSRQSAYQHSRLFPNIWLGHHDWQKHVCTITSPDAPGSASSVIEVMLGSTSLIPSLVDGASFFSPSFNPDRLSFWRDDWRSVGALIPWSGSRCHSKGTRPVWSAVERLSGHGTLWFPGQGGNRHYCPKVPLLLLSDNMGVGLAATEQARAQTIDIHAVTGLITL